MSFGIGMELFVEGAFAQGLSDNDPKTMVIWNAIGEYNRFFAEHEQFYTGTRSLSPVAVVLDNRSESLPLLNGLAGRGVLFDVNYERDLSPERLALSRPVAGCLLWVTWPRTMKQHVSAHDPCGLAKRQAKANASITIGSRPWMNWRKLCYRLAGRDLCKWRLQAGFVTTWFKSRKMAEP